MLNQPAEAKREVLSLILGDLDEFKKCVDLRETLNLCGKEWMYKSAIPLSEAISKKVKKNLKSSVKVDVKSRLENVSTPFHLLSESIPSECIDVDNGLRVREQKWDEWLQICWGHDHDTLSMLSMLPMFPYSQSSKQFVEDVEKLPIIQSPVGSEQLKDIVDSHTHSSSLYPPSLQWAHCINTGLSIKELLNNQNKKDKFWCVHNVQSYEQHYKLTYLYLSTARVLLGALLDFYQLISISSDNILLGNKVDAEILSGLVEKVMKLISTNEDNQAIREELQVLIRKGLPELKDNQFKMLDTSIYQGESFQDKDNVYSFLQTERKCIATLLWQAYQNKLGIFLQEVLLTYLRCKGAWFQRNSGKNLENSELLEYLLFKSYHLSSVTTNMFNKFHSPMSEATKQFYKTSNYLDNQYLKKVEVRLSCMESTNLERTINWLCSVYNNINWGLVLSFPRYSYENKEEDIQNWYNPYLDFINEIFNNNQVSDRVCGIDILGINQSIHWHEYAILTKKLREYIEKEKKKKCFITYHFSEDTKEISLKEICEIWIIFNEAELKKCDRISHGLGLLSPTIQMTEGKTTMKLTEWDLIRDSLDKFIKIDTLPNKDKIQLLYDQLKSNKKTNREVAELDNVVMSELAASLQPFVKKKLIDTGILLEICPTSNWCIAGISLPTRHPVKSWIEAGGDYLVGTDNPAIFPCTIESEYYSLQRLMEQPNMPEDTSHPSFESQSKNLDVFLAHKNTDQDQIKAIADALEQRGIKPWLDDAQIPPGRSFQDEIQKAISSVKSAAIFIGLQGIGQWQNWELKALISQCVKRNIPVIPVLLPGVTDLPEHLLLLEQFRSVSFSNEINDKNALDLLEWGITGQKPNTIQQNEKPGQVPTQENLQTIYPSANEVSQETSSEENNYKWDVFLSHSSADKDKVREVANKFRNHGLEVWLDEEQIHFGDSVTGKIEEGVTDSKKIIVCLSPSLGKSNWCRAEYAPIINDEISRHGSIRVIPLVIESVETANIPLFLRDKLRVKYSDSDDWQKLLKQLGQPDEKSGIIQTQEIIQSISQSTNGVPREGSCSCVDKLKQLMSEGKLRERMVDRMNISEVRTIWDDTFNKQMENISGYSDKDYFIELIRRAEQHRLTSKLFENICKERPDIANP